MKKWVSLILLLLMMPLLLCGWALVPGAMGEGMAAAPVAFDATPIVAAGIVLIGAALGAVLLWLTYKYLVPLLKVPILGTLAKWAVDFAEQQLGSGNGAVKFDMAAEYVVKVLAGLHVQVDPEQIRAAIISAWTALNLGQIAAGIKNGVNTQLIE
jgi:hypothetical protein